MTKSKAVDIIFENDDFVALNKASGMLTIPDRHNEALPSLYKYLQDQYGKIFIVHRLDRDTTGIVLFAKNEATHKYLSQLFEQRKIDKFYLGIITGAVNEKEGTINEPISEHPHNLGMMAVNKKGKASVTDFNVIEDHGIYSLIEFKIHTGRTHQIRVHMKFAGHPIICDPLYGDGKPVLLSSFKKKYKLSQHDEEERPMISRLALHSYKLAFKDAHGKDYTLEAPLPKDMRALLQQLKKQRK
ncbi:MAG: RluA family pseudouridine synthase [Ginsengibacter sp.]